ncbi:MAG: fasciclin domain-containing protein, partial [Bacteroidota bacterium]
TSDPNDLSETATSAGLTTLLAATDATGLTATLEAQSDITVFAPTNDAFAALLTALDVSDLNGLINLLGESRVADILQYHVVASSAFAADLQDGQTLNTLAGQTLTVNVASDGGVSISDVSGNTFNVVTADVEISNGVVHVIDGVLISTPTVADVAVANGLTTLLEALEIAGLTQALLDQTTMTVFAPTNAAFESLLNAIGQGELEDIPVDVLTRVLQYHVVSGSALLSTNLNDGDTAPTLLQENVTVNISGTNVSIDNSNVTTADVAITNGVVHVLDAVLVPSLEASIVNTVVEPAYFNKDFSTLTAAVVKAELLNTLIDGQANLTVFAPNNAAFEAAGITSLDNLSKEDLTPILQYHVLGSEVKEANLPATGSAVSTLNGDFYLSINNEGVFINGSTEVIATDIDQDNGVVHVIDKTLIPADQDVVEIAVAMSEMTEGAEFGQLVAALTAVENDMNAPDLITVLKGNGPFTVFAPTDAAFQTLYDAVPDSDQDGDNDITDLVAAVPDGLNTIAVVLQYHVFNGRVFSTDIPNLLDGNTSVSITPVAGGNWTLNSNLTITPTDAALGLELDDAEIVGTDVLGTNGVIHVIDQVILP